MRVCVECCPVVCRLWSISWQVRRSVVGCFNLSQEADDKPTVGNTAARDWLKKARPKTAVCPPKSDYCDLCKEYQEEISRAQTTATRMSESGNANATVLQQQKDLAESYKQLLAAHKHTAQGCIDEYKRHRQQSQADWNRINALIQSENHSVADMQELNDLREQFVCLIDADYQQGKLLPHWGYSAQPGASYYKQKLCFDNFGIVCHGAPENFFYLYHEGAVGSKSADTTISCLDHFIRQHVPAWVKHIAIVLDNAMVNKNQFTVGWMGQLVNSRFDSCRLLLMIPGHTKFSPDEAFARVSHTFYRYVSRQRRVHRSELV